MEGGARPGVNEPRAGGRGTGDLAMTREYGRRGDDAIELPAPAKLNLFLHVVGRRPDGYHELQTVFQFLDLADRVRIASRNDTLLRRTTAIAGVEETDDLVIRAARLLRDESGIEAGADIAVEKRIPLGGGLGGGSSDAASTLVGLDRLWGLGMSTDRLAAVGVKLGADVPVFVRGLAAVGGGRGRASGPRSFWSNRGTCFSCCPSGCPPPRCSTRPR